MTQNPYQAPTADAPVENPHPPGQVGVEQLRAIANTQRMLMFCILAYLAGLVLSGVLPQPLKLVGGLLYIVGGIAAVVYVILLGVKLHSTGVAILLGVLTFVPCVGLIVMLVVNSKATEILKANGIKVGLLGASPSSLP